MPNQIEDEEQEVEHCAFCQNTDIQMLEMTYHLGALRPPREPWWREDTDEILVCEDHYFVCDDCDCRFHPDRMYSETRCVACQEQYSQCVGCSEEFSVEDLQYDSCDDPYCENCWESLDDNDDDDQYDYPSVQTRRAIQSYSYKPSPLFGLVVDGELQRIMEPRHKNANQVFMGFELETNRRSYDFDLADSAQHLLNATGDSDYLYNKEDGSISGFEIVTHPCTLEAHKLLLPREALTELANKYGLSSWSSVNGTGAGLHVHVSKKSFKAPTHLYKFQLFHYRNSAIIKKFAGRDSSRWATFDRSIYDSMTEIAKGNRSQDNRYSALNFQNRTTVELRYFRGSLKPETVLGVLEFVHSVHEYTRILTSKEVATNGLDWSRYKAWLADQNYEFLPTVMATRCV